MITCTRSCNSQGGASLSPHEENEKGQNTTSFSAVLKNNLTKWSWCPTTLTLPRSVRGRALTATEVAKYIRGVMAAQVTTSTRA